MDKIIDDITKQRNRKNQAQTKEKTAKLPRYECHDHILKLLSGDVANAFADLGTLPRRLLVVECAQNEIPAVLVVNEDDRTVSLISEDAVNAIVYRHLIDQSMNCFDRANWAWNLSQKELKEIIKTWMHDPSTPRIKMPRTIGFKSDPDLVFHRLAFDPDLGVESLDDLSAWAPTWHEFVMRLQNRDGFCARIGSIFYPEADRKQAVWLSGPKDSGKSQIALQLQKLCGPAFKTLGDSDLKDKFLKYELIGKRVAVMNEVTPSFIKTEEFKSLTGDDEHRVRPLGKQGFTARLETLIFFLSNNPPETQSKKELFERIIYCRVDGLPANVTPMGQTAYQALLTSEIAQFIGYCVNVYRNLPGSRLPNNMNELIEVVEEKEMIYALFFQQNFIEGENEECSSRDFSATLNEIKNDLRRKATENWILRNKVLGRRRETKRSDRSIHYIGFKPGKHYKVVKVSEQQDRTGLAGM